MMAVPTAAAHGSAPQMTRSQAFHLSEEPSNLMGQTPGGPQDICWAFPPLSWSEQGAPRTKAATARPSHAQSK